MEKNMNMQDKELDALFKSKLNDMEMAPPEHLWTNISHELDAGKKRKPVTAYFSIAASIVVLITAGLLFIPRQVKVIKPLNRPDKIAQHTEPARKPEADKPSAPPAVLKETIAPVQALATIKHQRKLNAEKPAPGNNVKTDAAVIEQPKHQPVLAAVAKKLPAATAVVPDSDVELSPKTISADAEPFKTKPVVMASANLPQTDTREARPVKKKKINSFGGLLNALVSKIDKRKDKVIEFSDDDENSITGINLGIIKVKKEEE